MSTPGNTYRDSSLGPDQIRMNGRFDANAGGAVSNVYGKGFRVARTATGTYTVSLGPVVAPTPFKRLIGFTWGSLQAAGVFVALKALTDSSANATAPAVVLVNVDTSGNAADITATLFFEFVFGTSELNS